MKDNNDKQNKTTQLRAQPQIDKHFVQSQGTTQMKAKPLNNPFVKGATPIQRKKRGETDQTDETAQLEAIEHPKNAQPVQAKAQENKTGMPNNLKSGIESLSGIDMGDVKVHYNSDKPAQLQAYAYAQGTDIHLASGQEKHLPHEAWHVVQQKQGRVQATTQLKSVSINDDSALEQEADIMGARANSMTSQASSMSSLAISNKSSQTAQLRSKKEREVYRPERQSLVARLNKVHKTMTEEEIASCKEYLAEMLSYIKQEEDTDEAQDKQFDNALSALKGIIFPAEHRAIQADIDGSVAGMYKDDIANYFNAHAIKEARKEKKEKEEEEEEKDRLGNLHFSALPTATQNIIREYYRDDFELEPHLDSKDRDSIRKKKEEEKRAEKTKELDGTMKKANIPKMVDEYIKSIAGILDDAANKAAKRGVTPDKEGKLRSWHLNDTGMLPRDVLRRATVGSGKDGKRMPDIANGFASKGEKKDDRGWSTARRQLRAQWEKDVAENAGFQGGYLEGYNSKSKGAGGVDAFYKDAASQEPGYVEINAAGWQESISQARLLYDYLEDRWFLTTDHYHDYFWEITVPASIKADEKNKTGHKEEDGDEKGKEEGDDGRRDFLASINNCLLEAIDGASGGNRNAAYAGMRLAMEGLGLGRIGTYLYAGQQQAEYILQQFGLANHTVIVWQADGTPQEVGTSGAGATLLHIYHIGDNHFTAEPISAAQKKEMEGYKKK